VVRLAAAHNNVEPSTALPVSQASEDSFLTETPAHEQAQQVRELQQLRGLQQLQLMQQRAAYEAQQQQQQQ